ncbi:MAG: DUF4175 family protein [Myxococcales bacterium]|nr:MAG: DUF4175 family protein [Myxococcales bacterium]
MGQVFSAVEAPRAAWHPALGYARRARMSSPRARARTSPAPLELLGSRFRTKVARARRQLGWALVLLGLVVGAHLARRGTGSLRLAGAALLVAAIAALAVVVVHARRTLQDKRRLLGATLLRAEPAIGARALRALSLVERAEAGGAEQGESPDLAQLHFQRVLSQAPTAALDKWAAKVADRTRLLLLAALVAAGAILAFDPARVLEGLDVMLARRGYAPVPMPWLSSLQVDSQPPAYLRQDAHRLFTEGTNHEPAGSTIVVQGVPEREGRKLVLLGDGREVPFVSDGAGNVVARWVLARAVELRVAARFGDVLIVEPQSLLVEAEADRAPEVALEGAPRKVELKDLQSLELRYSAEDDHGIREIALVLRAGGREDRRTLERLDGEAKQRAGAQALSPRDALLRRSFLPVEVTIEARDNDGVSGAKWGASQPITVVPPGIGEAEAARYAALARARASLIAAYAAAQREADAAAQKAAPAVAPEALRKAQTEQVKEALAPLLQFVDATFAGAAVPKPLKAFLQGQARALQRPAATRETYVRRLEDVLLAVDAALRATGNRDAEAVAKRLADVADEVAEGAKLGLDPEKKSASSRRLDAALPVLQNGADSLLTLSDLGADVGSVAQGEIRRVRRGLEAKSYLEAELAARHLAARLRRPKPSFNAMGGGGGGVESGSRGGKGGPKQPGEASQAHQQFQELMRELSQLSAEHAGEIASVENALESAEQSEQDPELSREAKERADALRRALEDLPDYAPGQSASEQAAALAREHGRAMAESLSRLSLKDAKQSADSAKQQLGTANSRSDGGDVSKRAIERAERELSKQGAWVEELLKKSRERESARAKESLERSGKREQELAERAQNISGRGSHGEAALPGEVAEALDRAEGLMREAAQQLGGGNGEKALELQREAQRLLDQNDDDAKNDEPKDGGKDADQPPPKDGHESERGSMSQDAGVPGRGKNQKAEEFRRRVLEGLSRDKGGKLGPAVKRYAEGLLK